MNKIIFVLIIMFIAAIIPLFIGSIFLQILLSKKKNWILGLILPLFCFILSLTIIIGSTIFTSSFIMFILSNIPTIIYTQIYISNYKHRKELVKESHDK